MKVMVMVKANDDIEAGGPPSTELLSEMGAFNERLVDEGIMLAGEGLLPSSTGKRVRYSPDGSTSVVDGPFSETKELIAGFWIWQVKDMDEALEWARRIPNTDRVHSEVEIRQVAEAEDFGDAMTPELAEAEDRLRARVASRS